MDQDPDSTSPDNGDGAGPRPSRSPFRRRGLPNPPGPPDDPDPRTKPKLRKLRAALVLAGLSVLALVSALFGMMMAVAQNLPSLESREQYERAKNSVVFDINNEKLATLTNNQGRIFLTSEEISATMKEAVVAIEDQRFYDHRGIDWQGMARALYQDVLSGSAQQGASTITQQFVKNALAAQQSRTILQKFREAAIAYHLERQWSKDKIITEYLNEIYFGEGATGIEAAARTYFGGLPEHQGCGKGAGSTPCASQLYPWEAALLAGMISSPSAYSPRVNPVTALERRSLVLQKMAEQGYITPEEAVEYADPDLHALPKPDQILPPEENSAAPYFTSWLRQQLVDRYGAGEAFGGGLRITSTLDLDLQRSVEEAAFGRTSSVGLDTSVVVLDNDTAAIRAMVGGSNYQESPFNLATNGHRQPGSSFKPFTLITALEQGHSTAEVFASAPQEIPFTVKVEKKNGKTDEVPEVFKVANYNDSYLGSASLSTATTYSDNSVYAQLGMQVGPENVAATAEKLGVETDLSSDIEYSIEGRDYAPYNPAMILGGLSVGVTPLEMAHAYNTIAANGARISGTMAASSDGPLGINKVEACKQEDAEVLGEDCDDPEERELAEDQTGASGENKVETKQVIDPSVAETARSVLATVVSSGTGRRAATGESTWGKTGTTDDNGDAWFCGATDEITACIWVGHAESNTPMLTEFGGAPVDGGTIPALIFADVVNAYESLEAARKAGEDPETSEIAPSTTSSSSTVTPDPATEPAAAPAETADPAETSESPAPPADSTGAGSAPVSSGGGVAPG
jgi:penicillin-binding protein 1A